MNIYDCVVKRIYELCEERNITPNALSCFAEIFQSTVKSILNGESKNQGIVTLKKICDDLDITIVDFLIPRIITNLSRELNSEPLNIDLISSIFADITEIKLCGLFAGIEEKTRRKTVIYEKHLLKCYFIK